MARRGGSEPSRKSAEIIPIAGHRGGETGADPLGDFLRNRAAAHEKLGEPIPIPLLRNGAIGAGLLILAALAFAVLPDPTSMREGGFLFLGADLVADITEVGKSLAAFLFVGGLLLLVGDAVLVAAKPRVPLEAHYACAGQLVVGASAVAPAALVLAILIGTLLVWIAIICLVLAIIGAVLGGS